MSSPETLEQDQIGSSLFANLYEQFGSDLIEARRFIATECRDPEMRRQFDDLEAETLYLLIRHAQPDELTEISPCDGWSTTWMLKAMQDNDKGKLHSFDIHDRAKRFVPQSLQDRWELHLGDVRQAPLPSSTDFLLIDSKHTYPFARWYFKEVMPRVKEGAPVVIHDIASGLPLLGVHGVWTGFNSPGTEGWRVKRYLAKRDIGYYTLCGALVDGYANSALTELYRAKAGVGDESLSSSTRNPAVSSEHLLHKLGSDDKAFVVGFGLPFAGAGDDLEAGFVAGFKNLSHRYSILSVLGHSDHSVSEALSAAIGGGD